MITGSMISIGYIVLALYWVPKKKEEAATQEGVVFQ
jgi:hypothetical protein